MSSPVATCDASSSDSFPGFGEGAPLDVPGLGSASASVVFARRLREGTWSAFADAVASVGNCAHPVRLAGSSVTVDTATGAVLSSFSSDDAPLGVLMRRCGNRRAHICPSCSRLYARDTFEMIRAGVEGGKRVPDAVATNPLVFLTVTAPSFGLVHGARSAGGICRPRRRDDRTRCSHGRPLWCNARHDDGDERCGQPLCSDCYDYISHLIWQWWAPELWRRLTIEVRRALASRLDMTETRLGDQASLQYAKVAEYQARGVIHFHALVRLDGPKASGVGAPAPARIDGADLAKVLADAAARVKYTAPAVDVDDSERVLRFGAQVDARVVRAGSRTDDLAGPLTPGQVAGYLAKYATKDATVVPGANRRPSPHLCRLRAEIDRLGERSWKGRRLTGEDNPYGLLRKWRAALGFRGHFSTKSRSYSVTLGALRRARTRWQAIAADSRRTGEPIDVADLEARLLADDEEEATLVVGEWAYAGRGWDDLAETALATAAAARAREYDQWKVQQRKETRSTDTEGI